MEIFYFIYADNVCQKENYFLLDILDDNTNSFI